MVISGEMKQIVSVKGDKFSFIFVADVTSLVLLEPTGSLAIHPVTVRMEELVTQYQEAVTAHVGGR